MWCNRRIVKIKLLGWFMKERELFCLLKKLFYIVRKYLCKKDLLIEVKNVLNDIFNVLEIELDNDIFNR